MGFNLKLTRNFALNCMANISIGRNCTLIIIDNISFCPTAYVKLHAQFIKAQSNITNEISLEIHWFRGIHNASLPLNTQ